MLPERRRPDHLLLRAACGEEVERPPVWAMRQAGRWDPEFNRLRAGLSFYEFSENVELAARASLLPRRFGVDAIILFYDITSLPVAMGQPFVLRPSVGPVPDHPVRTLADVERLAAEPDPERYRHIRDLLHLVKADLDGALPVLVFAGAPFTTATYCISTGKDLAATRRFAAEQPGVWDALLDRLTTATIGFLRTLIHEGADAYQLFDSWAGMLDADEYRRWAQPRQAAVFAAATGAPRILFVKECPYLEWMTQSGADVVSLGVRHDLAAARRDHPKLVFQGNVDQELLRTGTPDQATAATKACVAAGGGRRHIVNLSHGVDRETPVANFEAYVRAVRGG
ncbi:MAG TPA: uroporphyrinogen decarboxylase family protein [Gemmataceae bacterium]|nr:uroporphyrinogen decarboxylase family protein [Gemmataceae bacterium]